MHSKQPVPKACPCICSFPAFMYTPDNDKLANSVPMQLMCDMAQIQRQLPNALLCSCADGRAVASNQASGTVASFFQVGRQDLYREDNTTLPCFRDQSNAAHKNRLPTGFRVLLGASNNLQECPTFTCRQNIGGCSCAAFLPAAHAFHGLDLVTAELADGGSHGPCRV